MAQAAHTASSTMLKRRNAIVSNTMDAMETQTTSTIAKTAKDIVELEVIEIMIFNV